MGRRGKGSGFSFVNTLAVFGDKVAAFFDAPPAAEWVMQVYNPAGSGKVLVGFSTSLFQNRATGTGADVFDLSTYLQTVQLTDDAAAEIDAAFTDAAQAGSPLGVLSYTAAGGPTGQKIATGYLGVSKEATVPQISSLDVETLGIITLTPGNGVGLHFGPTGGDTLASRLNVTWVELDENLSEHF